MLRMAHHDAAPETAPTEARQIPYLPGSGDLGLYLYRLMVELENLSKKANTVQLCSCGLVGSGENGDTLDSARADSAAAAYADLCGLLAACGRFDALALVQGFRPPHRSSHHAPARP